ncbi:MAG TPA: hypothetical protein VI636_23565 [Candidatus Angelobacter sp.]
MTDFFHGIHLLLLASAAVLSLGAFLVRNLLQEFSQFFRKDAAPSDVCHGCHCAPVVIVVQVNGTPITNSNETPNGLREQSSHTQNAIETLQKIIPALPVNVPLRMNVSNILSELREHQLRLENALAALEGSAPEKPRDAVQSVVNPGRTVSAETKKRISEGLKKSWAGRKKVS